MESLFASGASAPFQIVDSHMVGNAERGIHATPILRPPTDGVASMVNHPHQKLQPDRHSHILTQLLQHQGSSWKSPTEKSIWAAAAALAEALTAVESFSLHSDRVEVG
jgi:hypothetical protein